MGDSVAFGQFVQPHLTWPALVSKSIEELGIAALIQSSAVNGETTRLAMGRLYFSILNHLPTHVFFQYGINDANSWDSELGVQRVPAMSFSANLREMVERSAASGVDSIFMGTNHPISPPGNSPKTSSLKASVLEYNQIVRDIVMASGHLDSQVILIDFESIFMGADYSYLLPDGVHLNELGHKLYCDYALERFFTQIR
jgi:lysophospholipase L1-like esterase